MSDSIIYHRLLRYNVSSFYNIILAFYSANFSAFLCFIPAIDNWAVCDSFCSSMKCPKKDKAVLWDFVQPYIYSDKEFEQRFAAVIMLGKFVNEEYIDSTLKALTEISAERYYSSMAVAWAAAECFIKFPERAEPYLSTEYLDRATLERTIRKLCDSFRVTAETKTRLKDLLKVE